VDVFQDWIREPAPDHLFEMTERSIAVACPRNPGPPRQETFAQPLLQISPIAANFLNAQLCRDALTQLAPLEKGKRVRTALVIPDYAVRMAILDFEALPASEEERAALVRFRLRKSVPFSIEEAQVAYAIQSNIPKRVELLAVAIAKPILDEYEMLFADAGYRVGLVTPSSLAALPLCATAEPGLTLVAKAAGSTLSVLLLEQARLRLIRVLDLAGSEADNSEADGAEAEDFSVLALVQQTLAYAEDQLGQQVRRLLLCGFGSETDSVGSLAQSEFGIPYAALRSRFGALGQENAGVLGMLEQFAA
jgi:type IV pilus assembly protein PilM